MCGTVLEIRSNLNRTISWLESVRKEREERERKEREARYEAARKERERLDAEWSAAHPILDKFSYITRYNYDNYTYEGIPCKVYFYEWSNVKNVPIEFRAAIPFYRFLDDCKISYTMENDKKLRNNSVLYMTCKPYCNELIIENSYEDLCNALSSISGT